MDSEQLLLYAVTDRMWGKAEYFYVQIEQALKGGVTILQLREKNMTDDAFLKEAIVVKKLCDRYNVPLIINDNVEVAIQCGAAGVHVGNEDMPVAEIRERVGKHFIIGATAKTVEQARKAEKAGADYLGVGAVFASPTKKNARRITKEQLLAITSAAAIPAVAIGGITIDNVKQLKGYGIKGIAVSGAAFGAEDITDTCRKLRDKAGCIVSEGCMKTVLSIAGSDCSGGAGVQADIKTMIMNGVYGMTAITALTAQNTMAVSAISEVSPDFLAKQIEAVFDDIRPDAVKIGMAPSASLMHVIAEEMKHYKAKNIVVDPVMIATSGGRLMDEEAVSILKKELLPQASLVTPNLSEAAVLSGMKVNNHETMLLAAENIYKNCHCNVLLKGGHSSSDADDLLYGEGNVQWIRGQRIDNPNSHGTGCTLSSAIASWLAKGYPLELAVRAAKDYLSGALLAELDLGKGSGPVNHGYKIMN